MAAKKKELLGLEMAVPETVLPTEDTSPPESAEIPVSVPPDGGDLNELLASMDQPSEEMPDSGDDTLPKITENEMFGEETGGDSQADGGSSPDMEVPAVQESAPGSEIEDAPVPPSDDTAAAENSVEPVVGDALEAETPKPKRAARKKKAAPVENAEPAKDTPADMAPQETAPAAEQDTPPDTEEVPAAETAPEPAEEQPVEESPAPAPQRTSAPRQASILTIRNRDEVETEEEREDIIWHEIHNAYRTRRILTGRLGGMEQLDNRKTVAVVDYKGFRILIPLKEMMIILSRSPSGQEYADLMLRQSKILGNMLGADIDFVVRGIDSKTRSVVASRREAMMRKRQTFYFDLDAEGMYRIYEGRIVQARVIAVAEKVIRVEVFGVECSIMARDLAWDWIADAHERFAVGDEVLVRILSVRRNSLEDLGIRADIKSTLENTDRDNLQKCRIQGKYAGKVTDVHKGVVYVRLANGVNAVAHSCYDYRMPGKKDDVSFAVTHLDVERGIALGIITRIIRQNL